MKKEITQRGFGIIKFQDKYGESCSIQKSSLATDDCIWFGCDRNGIFKDGDRTYESSMRMHLNREKVKELLPILQKFVETGEI
jgi:hypothetical protein